MFDPPLTRYDISQLIEFLQGSRRRAVNEGLAVPFDRLLCELQQRHRIDPRIDVQV